MAINVTNTIAEQMRHMPLPICAKCNKPVDKLVQAPHFDNRSGNLTSCIAFAAMCHGETETVVVPLEVFFSIGPIHEMSFSGMAFDSKKVRGVEMLVLEAANV